MDDGVYYMPSDLHLIVLHRIAKKNIPPSRILQCAHDPPFFVTGRPVQAGFIQRLSTLSVFIQLKHLQLVGKLE